MQLLAQASQWTNRTTRAAEALAAIGAGGALFIRQRVHLKLTAPTSTTVQVDVSTDGEGWTPLETFTFAGLPTFIGFGGSAERPDDAAPQGGTFAVDFIRAFEDPEGLSRLSTDGGRQFYP